MVPDKFNMVDMGGIDLIAMQDQEIPGLYSKLVESITQCRYQCLYNWMFDGIVIPPTYVSMEVDENENVNINEMVYVNQLDEIHIYSLEAPPVIVSLEVTENGTYNKESGQDGFNPVVVNVPEKVIVPLSVTSNGIYNHGDTEDGFDPVTVQVPIPVILQETFTENGIYPIPEGYGGYGPVTVNVQNSSPPKPSIPDGYTELEYISFIPHAGYQVTIPSIAGIVEVKFRATGGSGERCAFGYRAQSSDPKDFEIRQTDATAGAWMRAGNDYIATPTISNPELNVDYLVKLLCLSFRTTAFIGRYATYSSNAYFGFYGRIYYISCLDPISNTYFAYFLPVRRNSDNSIGYLELVSETFYSTLNTTGGGSVTAGPDVN